MTKIYVVKVCDLENNATCVTDVFTNRKKAQAFMEYWNIQMIGKHHYWISEYEINDNDYNDLLKDLKKERGL